MQREPLCYSAGSRMEEGKRGIFVRVQFFTACYFISICRGQRGDQSGFLGLGIQVLEISIFSIYLTVQGKKGTAHISTLACLGCDR